MHGLVSLSVTGCIQPIDNISSFDGIRVIHAIRFISEIHCVGGMMLGSGYRLPNLFIIPREPLEHAYRTTKGEHERGDENGTMR